MQELYAIKDLQMDNFRNPFWVPHVVEATRAIQTVLNEPKSQLAQFPQHFELWYLATLDEQSGDIIDLTKRLVITLTELKKQT